MMWQIFGHFEQKFIILINWEYKLSINYLRPLNVRAKQSFHHFIRLRCNQSEQKSWVIYSTKVVVFILFVVQFKV